MSLVDEAAMALAGPGAGGPGAGAAGPKTTTHAAEVCGVRTTFVLTAYSNRIFVAVAQTEGFGTLVRLAPCI
jgi:hypothetical protein